MDGRIAAEIELLRCAFPRIVYEEAGHWFMIPEYPLGETADWALSPLPVVFHAQPGHPGQAPYGIWVPTGVRVRGEKPNNIQDPANKQPPFPGRWAVLSWTVDGDQWRPKENPSEGANLLDYALGFNDRFRQGK